jgi:hypothetical protein
MTDLGVEMDPDRETRRTTLTAYLCARNIVVSYVCFMCIVATSVFSQVFPLKISSGGRYLEDQTGSPFFVNAESMWSILVQCTYANADVYLLDRQSKGVNTILVQLIAKFTTNAPNNINGHSPFTGANFTTPREVYFSHADSIINRAKDLGFIILLDVAYLGWTGDASQGWVNEIAAASTSDMLTWGYFVGNRYKNNPAIAWVVGGDRDPSAVQAKLDSVVSGIRSVDTAYSRLYTVHNENGSQAITHWPGRTWLNLNNIYSHSLTVYNEAAAAYSVTPAMPYFPIEMWYENEHGVTPVQLRMHAYWTILRGACGQLFGNNPLWGMGYNFQGGGTNWQAQLNSPGSIGMYYMARLFRSRNWHRLVPDLGSSVMTSGAGTGEAYATTAYASDSSSIIAYLPTQRSVTIAPAKLKGDSIHVWWYNPSNSAVTDVGIFSKVSRNYNPPNTGDWVMVIDGKDFNFNQPGNLAPRLVSPANSSAGQSLNPFLVWNAGEGAESYSVHVALDPGFGTTVLLDSLVVDTTRQVSGLMNGTTYFWRVRSRNSLGQSPWSLVWSFTTSSSGTTQILHVVDGWNLISVPLSVPDSRTITLFPTATAHSFSFISGGGYQRQDTLLNGIGYGLKYGGAQNVSVTGLPRTQDTITVRPGWNIIGSISSPVDTSTIQSIPPGVRISQFYEYASGYTAAASIDPGKGYWVKTNAAGRLILSSGGLAQPASRKSSGTKPLNKR